MKHLKLFENEASYEAFKSGSDFVLPNVSFIEGGEKLYYNPFVAEPSYIIRATYNNRYADDSYPIVKLVDTIKSIKIDGELCDLSEHSGWYYHPFTTAGDHYVEIEKTDTIINDGMFNETLLTSIILPDGITSIGKRAFELTKLSSITFPASITSIGDMAFSQQFNAIKEITCLATTAPELGNQTLSDEDAFGYGGVLKYPAGSDYSSWIAALPYGWTTEEI